MKKFKISFVAVIALLIGIAASSFTVHTQVKKSTTLSWYEFNGTGDPLYAENYRIVTGTPGCNTLPDKVCAIEANPGLEQEQPSQDDLDAIIFASGTFTTTASHLKYRN